MCSGPVSGETTSAAASRMPTRLRSPLPSAETTGRCTPLDDRPLGVASSRGDSPPTSTGCRPKSRSERVRHLGPALREPVLLRLAAADTSGAIGRSNFAKNSCCHARSSGHGPRSHVTGLGRHAERGEEFEVLVLHVLHRVRRDLRVGEQPVEIARARAVEAELHRRGASAVSTPALRYTWSSITTSKGVRERACARREGAPAALRGRRGRSRPPRGARARASPGRAAAPT